jgi:hypothetical protein
MIIVRDVKSPRWKKIARGTRAELSVVLVYQNQLKESP